jgi:hypothetical protein
MKVQNTAAQTVNTESAMLQGLLESNITIYLICSDQQRTITSTKLR